MVDGRADSALVERARGGDARAFREIVVRHEGAVAATVIGMLGPGDEADDVGQETFVRFYRSMDRFRSDAALRTYLVRIAMNLSLNALKRRKRSEGRHLRIDGSEPTAGAAAATVVDADAQPDIAFDRQEREQAVRRAIDGLDEKHRAVVVLRMIDQRSTRETAELLEIPEGTVLSRLSRGLKKLEEDLKEWMSHDD